MQSIPVQQAQGDSQCSLIIHASLIKDDQPGERLEEQSFQPVTLADDPVVIKAVQKVAAVERYRRMETSSV